MGMTTMKMNKEKDKPKSKSKHKTKEIRQNHKSLKTKNEVYKQKCKQIIIVIKQENVNTKGTKKKAMEQDHISNWC